MSREALAAYREARDRQLSRNEARHIHTLVLQARGAPHVAGMRWPFELLQNALDAGPRRGRDAVTVHVHHKDDRTIFEHDGAPFSSQDLAALLSGGSSKDFGSTETTGRFGTGFLVTHVLAERTTLEGLIAVGDGYERFRLDLDRSGDEDQILQNIDFCNDAIEQAEYLSDATDIPSARFIYPTADLGSFTLGIDALHSALPYLYGTCSRLGQVSIITDSGAEETWSPRKIIPLDVQGLVASDRMIDVRDANSDKLYRILRFEVPNESVAALIYLEKVEDQWVARFPEDGDARIYRQYPLRASNFLPVNFVIDGSFQPDQERSKALMTEDDKLALSHGFQAAVTAVNYLLSEHVFRAHLLAKADSVDMGFESGDMDEAAWWRQQIGVFVGALGTLPIVETVTTLLPALESEGAYADFVSPYLLAESHGPETSIDRLWPLFDEATNLCPPIRDLAEDWSAIADGWARLAVKPNRVTVQALANYVREAATEDGNDATQVSELLINGDKHSWLARYIDTVGECWERRSGSDASIFRDLLPNQRSRLCSAAKLRRDANVSSKLKDICESVGFDVRSELLAAELTDTIDTLGLRYAPSALVKAITRQVRNEDIENEFLDKLLKLLPEDLACSEENAAAQSGTALFLSYLWESAGAAAAPLARKVPLVARSRKIAYWSTERMMMAPVLAWGESAREFSDAYPADRVLDDLYVTTDEALVTALTTWGMIHPDPIISGVVSLLEGPRLAGITAADFDADGVTVRAEEFSQIALLPREVINHIQDSEQARALLGLVLMHVARNDPRWREWRIVKGSRARESIDVPVRGALWLGDLRSRAWIPVHGEDDKPAKASADVTTLSSLLDPEWLDGNDDAIAVLTQCFGFDELDLRLLGIAPEVQGRVRQGLARLIESGGADPEFYEALVREVEGKQRRQRDVERCRRMGYAVQDAVRQALESHGLSVSLVDYGFDFEVTGLAVDDEIEAIAVRFALGPYFVEVKATTVGSVRLTPTQADKASSEAARYVLCVVDLRGVSDDQLDQEWTSDNVAPHVSMLGDIGDLIVGTYNLVQRAKNSEVGIRNEAALRYEVAPQIWSAGVTISDWVAQIAQDPAIRASSTS